MTTGIHRFFAFARERHSIYLRRQAGMSRENWTNDPILSKYRFTNVFRELDATTIIFRKTVREPLRGQPEVLLATVLWRWFNRASTCAAIFNMPWITIPGNDRPWTPFDLFLRSNKTDSLRDNILEHYSPGPYVTGAYVIKTPDGMDKLSGVLQCVEWFASRISNTDISEKHRVQFGTVLYDWQQTAASALAGSVTLEEMWRWLREFPYMGDFMAYEVVTDLRHTALLDSALDIMTWANPGPGAERGLHRVHSRAMTAEGKVAPGSRVSKATMLTEMRGLLAASQLPKYWPQMLDEGRSVHIGDYAEPLHGTGARHDWPQWEMREVEHTLCEWDKYERARLGHGRPRGVYR